VYRLTGAIPVLKTERYPKRMVVFDTEAWRSDYIHGVELQTLRLGVAKYIELPSFDKPHDHKYLHFHTVEQLGSWLEFLTRKDHTLYVYAHNLKYDLQLSGLYTWLVAEGWISKLFVIEDPPTFIKMHRGRVSITFVDTFNYWQTSLESMGLQLDDHKLPMPDESATELTWFSYCRRDVDVLGEYILKFVGFLQENDLCGLGLTLASQAFRSYRHRFMREEIVLHNDKHALNLERDGYFGGRCEAFFIGDHGKGDYYKLDVNSMYPHVMHGYAYPVELVGYSENVPLSRLNGHTQKYYCLAEVSLHTDAPAYALSNGVKLIFPVGSFRTVLHHEDLLRAIERGELIGVHRLAIYRRAEIFSDYVDFFYHLKQSAGEAGDMITRHQAKIFLNALYGKFGQREVISKIVPLEGEGKVMRLSGYSQALGRRVEVNYLGTTVEVRYKGGEAFYASPVIAGAVTANARAYLWHFIELVGVENVFYCDTDSLIVNQTGYERITPYLDLNRLGLWKLEGFASTLFIHSAKDYRFGEVTKTKGVPRKATQLDPNTWQYDQFRGAKTWVKQGMPTGVEVYRRTKQRVKTYDKGVVMPNGLVLPLRLSLGSDG
jgi:hypothetical protein